MSPPKASEVRRLPQRQRGHERVAALLEAAASCFVEKGYDATTMTEVAARAGAAIGSLYQYFPTKEVLAQALLEQYAQEIFADLDALAEQSAQWNTQQLAEGLCGFLIGFRRRRPAFAMLLEPVPAPPADGLGIRRRLRAEIQAVLARHAPHRSAEELHAAATATQHMMKAAVAIQAEPGMPGRTAALTQMQHALQLYLQGVFAK